MCPEGAQVELERERCVPKVLKLSSEEIGCKPLVPASVRHVLVQQRSAGRTDRGDVHLQALRNFQMKSRPLRNFATAGNFAAAAACGWGRADNTSALFKQCSVPTQEPGN